MPITPTRSPYDLQVQQTDLLQALVDKPAVSVGDITADLGAPSDAASAADGTGSISVIGALRRAILNWASLLARLPASLGAKAAAASLPVTLAPDGAGVASLSNIDGKLPALVAGRSPTEPLGQLGTSGTLAAGSASASYTLQAGTTRVSLVALTADMCIRVGTGTVTAVTTDHYLQSGERIDIGVPAGSKIAAIRAGSTDGSLRISELV